jgi:AcrR family transcriptional regulator
MGDDAGMTSAVVRERGSRPGRAGILAAATGLFAVQGVSGTSLQQIADAAGITKAAVYHHFPTKDDVVAAALAPALGALRQIVQTAGAHQEPRGRIEATIIGLANQAVQHRLVWSVLMQDAAVADHVRNDPAHTELFDGLQTLLAGPEPSTSDRLLVSVFLSGLLGPLLDPHCADVGDDDMREGIIRAGRRLLLDAPA